MVFVVFGVWAMADPRSFFEVLARFEPYNQHFLQDIGAFQVGLGAVLLLAVAMTAADALAAALLGTGLARPSTCSLTSSASTLAERRRPTFPSSLALPSFCWRAVGCAGARAGLDRADLIPAPAILARWPGAVVWSRR